MCYRLRSNDHAVPNILSVYTVMMDMTSTVSTVHVCSADLALQRWLYGKKVCAVKLNHMSDDSHAITEDRTAYRLLTSSVVTFHQAAHRSRYVSSCRLKPPLTATRRAEKFFQLLLVFQAACPAQEVRCI